LVCGVLRGYSECLCGYSEASFVLLNVLRTCEFSERIMESAVCQPTGPKFFSTRYIF